MMSPSESPVSPQKPLTKWGFLVQVASEKASEMDALAAMSHRKKRKAEERNGSRPAARAPRAVFGQEDSAQVGLIMQKYEVLLGIEADSKISSRRPRRFVGSVVRRLLEKPAEQTPIKSIDRALIFECQQLPPGRPLEHVQEYLVETVWDSETGLPDLCERLTGQSADLRSADVEQQPHSGFLLAQPQRPVDGGEFHFKLVLEDDEDQVSYWCKSRGSRYIEEDWEIRDQPEPKAERKAPQPPWPQCGVISQRGLPCPQRKESCPYHRRPSVTKAAPPPPPTQSHPIRVVEKGKKEVCGVMSQRGLRCPQKRGACPYHSAPAPRAKNAPQSPRPSAKRPSQSDDEETEEEKQKVTIKKQKKEEPVYVQEDLEAAPSEELEEYRKNLKELEDQAAEQARIDAERAATAAAAGGGADAEGAAAEEPKYYAKKGTELSLSVAADNYMVTVTEVDEAGTCLLGWSYPPGCARDAGALLALSVANHWRIARLPSPLSTKMWREELAGGARKYIADNTGMGVCNFTSSSLARVNDGQYVFVLVDSSGQARAISQPLGIKSNRVVSLSSGSGRHSAAVRIESQRRRSRTDTYEAAPSGKPAKEEKAKEERVHSKPTTPRERKEKVSSAPIKREITTCPSGNAEDMAGGRHRKSSHSDWSLVGARFSKKFEGHGEFEGVVLRDDGNLGFLVKYAAETDLEHIDAGELLDLIHRYRSAHPNGH